MPQLVLTTDYADKTDRGGYKTNRAVFSFTRKVKEKAAPLDSDMPLSVVSVKSVVRNNCGD